MPNRLAGAASSYLRQHAENPVDWRPWGPEAFAEAAALAKPVLLSIGYSACHWCHVMAHESFENRAIAARMNALFVNIKVDREERPDVDAAYMDAVQAMTGHGGWPMTVFLTPEGTPFYGGTYFPPAPRHGLPGFGQLVEAVSQAWRERRDEVIASADGLAAEIRRISEATDHAGANGEAHRLSVAAYADRLAVVAHAAHRLVEAVDARHGGFGGAPKFPQASNLAFLLGRHARAGSADFLDAVKLTLTAMADGGIHDHLGGGFHRYSVDAEWRVPHFEKMLYDNAQLARLYLDAWLVTGEPRFRTVAESTLDYLLAEMQDPAGGFYATQDADTAEGEGAFYAWTPDEVRRVLEPADATAAMAWYGITPGGNLDGKSVLSTRRTADRVARELEISEAELSARLSRSRDQLLAARNLRPRPATDPKVIVGWNGLAIDAFARAGAVLGRADYLQAAERAARFISDTLELPDGLVHGWRSGQLDGPAFQDDYAMLADGLVTLYEATFQPDWLRDARRLVNAMLDQFADGDPAGGLYRIGSRHEALFVRQKDVQDGAVPSGNAVAARVLARLSGLMGEPDLAELAERILDATSELQRRAPSAAGAALAVADDLLSGLVEVAIVGPWEAGGEALVAAVRQRFLPGTVLAYAKAVNPDDGSSDPDSRGGVGLLRGRTPVGGRAAAYVCRGQVCAAPETTVVGLLARLNRRG